MADWMDSFATSASSAPAVEKPAEPVSAPPPTPTGDWMDGYRPAPNPNLALKASQDIPPDKAAQVLKLQDQTGLPTHVIAPNVEDVQAKQDQQALSPNFIQDHPKTAELVGSDPHWAALLKDDIPGVGYMERQLNYLSNASMRSELELERTYHGLKGVVGAGGPDNSDRIAEIDRQLNTDFAPPAGASPVTQLFGKAVEVAPYAGAIALGAAEGIPATIAGATAFGAMETANAYLDYKNKKNEDGTPVPDDTARRWAVASGALTAALSILGPEAAEAANPAIKMLSRGALGEMLENTGLRAAVDKLLTSSIPESMLKTGAFFGGSTWGHIAAGVMAGSKDMSPMAILNSIFSPENNKKVLAASGTGAAVGGSMTAGMGAWGIYTDYSKATEAMNTQSAWANVGNAMKNTKAFDMAPEQIPKVMDRLAGDGHVYIPLDKWQEWAEKQKVDPREAWNQANGNTQAYDEALKTGTDLQMSSKTYAAKIAASDHNDFFSKVLRSNPQAMNGEEAESFIGKQSPEQQAARDAEFKIKEAVAPTPAAPESTATTVPEPLPAKETEPITPAPQSPQEAAAAQHIQAAEQDLGHKPLDLTGMGMTPEQEAGIRAAEERAHGAAQEEMVRKVIDQELKYKSGVWNQERKQVEDEVEKQSWDHPEFVAKEVLSKPVETKARSEEIARNEATKYEADRQQWDAWREILKSGIKPAEGMGNEYRSLPASVRNPEGRGYDEVAQEAREKGLMGVNEDIFKKIRELKRPLKPMSAEEYVPQVIRELEPLKLSRMIVKEQYPDADLDSLKGMLSSTVGVHPDEAAQILGFGSGDELIQKLKGLPDRGDWIQQETDRQMVARHPDITSDTNLPEEAIKAVNNEERGKLLRKQLEHFYTQEFAAAKGLTARMAGRIPRTEELREDVARDIATKNYRELSPRLYLQGMNLAQAEAERAMKAGELQSMVDHKRAELRNFEMYRVAQKAKDTINRRIDKVDGYQKKSIQEMLGKAGGTYRKDVNALLANPEFQNYKAMPYGRLMDYLDQIDSKVHEAREQGKLYALEKFQKLDDYRTGIIEQLAKDFNLGEKEMGFPKPRLTNEKPFLPETQAALTRMEFLFDHYDNWKPMGLAKQGFSDPIAQGRAHEGQLVQQQLFDLAKYNLNDLVEKIPFSERALWYAKMHYVPEIGMSLFKPNMLQVAAYRANDYTWKALLDGYGWTDAQGMAVISKLSQKELDLVDGLSKNFEALRPELFEKQKKFTGISPEAVKASPYEVNGRKMEGGYTPLTFDNELSVGGSIGDMFEKNWFTAKPSDSNLKSRTNPGGKAPSLDFNNNLRVLGKMIHWASFAEPLSDAAKIIGDKAIASHMVAALGKENFDLIRPWMKDIAGNNPLSASPIDRIYNMAKSASMIANLGLKTTSELKHLLNYSMTAKELGLQYAAKGVQTFLGNPMKTAERWEQIKVMDPYMRQWAANWDRDIRAAAQRLNIAGQPSIFGAESLVGRAMSVKGALTHNFTRMLFSIYGYAYMSIGGSAWEGAYIKAMDGSVDGITAGDEKNAIAYAGRTVRTTIAAGNTEDLPAIMRDKGLARLFTWFHGPANLMANNVQKDWQKFSGSKKTPGDMAKFAGAELMNLLPAALLGSALAGEAPKAKDKLKKWVQWGAGAMGSEILGLAPILRDIPYAIKSRGHEFEDPFMNVLSSPLWALWDLSHHVEHHARFSTSEIKNLGMTVGYFTEFPSRQVMSSWAVAHDWSAGRYRPSSVASGLWHVATGKEPRA